MDITTKQKKLIFVILSSALLIFIFVFGINTYYKDKENKQTSGQPVTYEMIEKAKLESNLCSSDELENQYRICCAIESGVKKGLLYNCTSQEYFEPEQRIYIVFDASRFDISYDPYFLHTYSDLNYEEDRPIMDSYILGALDRKESFLMKILGTVPQEVESFVLLKLSVYPDNTFNKKDEQVILDREVKVFKK